MSPAKVMLLSSSLAPSSVRTTGLFPSILRLNGKSSPGPGRSLALSPNTSYIHREWGYHLIHRLHFPVP